MKSRRIRKWEGDAREALDGGPGRGKLTTRPSREAVGAGQQAGVDDATRQRAVGVEQQRVGVEPRTGAVNTGHRSREARQHGIGSSDSESR